MTVRTSFWRSLSRAGLDAAGSDPRLRAPRRAASGSRRLPCGAPRPDTFHRARSPVVAVGLERRPPDEPERLPSARLEPCGPSGLSRACCSRAQPRPAPCRLLRAWACLVKGRLVASSYLALPRATLLFPARRRRVTTRERCVSPTSATDSRHEHPADCPIPGRTPCRAPPCGGSRFVLRRGAQTHPGPEPGGGRVWGPCHPLAR